MEQIYVICSSYKANADVVVSTKMYDVAFNYKHQGNNSENLWKCTSCQSAIESQDHVLFCPAYAQLRQGKNLDSDRDLSDYLMKVLIIREM